MGPMLFDIRNGPWASESESRLGIEECAAGINRHLAECRQHSPNIPGSHADFRGRRIHNSDRRRAGADSAGIWRMGAARDGRREELAKFCKRSAFIVMDSSTSESFETCDHDADRNQA